MELSNAVGKYLFQRSKAVRIIRGGDMNSFSTYLMYLMQVQSRNKVKGVLQLVFYLVDELCQSVGALWGLYCTPHE